VFVLPLLIPSVRAWVSGVDEDAPK
jgi:hypothetical protein